MKPRLTQLKSIRWHCLDCSTGKAKDVEECDIYDCSLWEFRFGKSPTKEDIEKVKEILVLRGAGYPEKTPQQVLYDMTPAEREARRIKYRVQIDALEKTRCTSKK